MNVLFTGSSGFLGREIVNFFNQKRIYSITTVGRSKENTIVCDLSLSSPILNKQYEFVIHAAGKAHAIPKNKIEEKEFYNVNLEGTKNFLFALEQKPPNTFVFISTVAVYGLEYGEMINENHSLNGSTSYAISKIKAENVVINFCKKNNINYVILRLPLISGYNPPGNLGAMIRAIGKGYYFRIGKGKARKSIVSSSDIAELIPDLYGKNGIYNLTDREHPSFSQIENHIAKLYKKNIFSLPEFIFKALALLGDIIPVFLINSNKLNKITKSLTFSDDKAVEELNWKPTSALEAIKI